MDVIETEKCMESTRRRLERADRALTAAMREMTAAKQAHTVSVANFDAATKQMNEAEAILARAWRVPPNIELTGAARPLCAASSDRRERG